MNGLPYYKAYPRDFIEGTIGMTFELKSAYRLVLDLIYLQGGKLPDDARYISGLLGCSVRAWNKYRSDLIEAGKIHAENGIIFNFRADKELESLRTLQEVKRENRSGSNKNKDLEKRPSNDTEPDTDKRKREPNGSQKKGTRLPDDWEPDLEFAQSAGLTISQAEREADKFRDWWPAQPGQKGVKLDWARTWKNWCRTAVERQQTRGSPPRQSASDAGYELLRDLENARNRTEDQNHLRLVGPVRQSG